MRPSLGVAPVCRSSAAQGVTDGRFNTHLQHSLLRVFQAGDALRLMRGTGAAGVLVGRGALGRPWLFAELADVFSGRPPRPPPSLSGKSSAVGRWEASRQHTEPCTVLASAGSSFC